MATNSQENEVISTEERTRSESRIFDVYKTIGLVSNPVPCTIRYIHNRRENFIISCSGKTINTFVGQQLKLISVSSPTSCDILCMTSDVYHVYTGVGNKIYAWRRGTELQHTYVGHESDVQFLLVIAGNLLSIGKKGELCIHDIKTEEILTKIQISSPTFEPTTLIHPHGFINKILIGSAEGTLLLWNFSTRKAIHTFDSFVGSRINAIATGNVFGVVAIALSKKKIAVHNIEFDETIMVLECLDEPISVAFRGSPSYLIAGGATGSISAWDLESKQLISYQKFAHQGSVTGLVVFESEPLFVSSSTDNSIKAWIFDKPDGGFRLLNTREGHRLPPTLARFHGEQNLCVLTAGEDKCLKSFHLHNETYNRTISNYVERTDDEKGRGVPINTFVNSCGNHRPLAEDIVAFSTPNGSLAHTFSFENAKKGKDLDPTMQNNRIAITCAYLTSDNEWAILGSSTGGVIKFNLQSKVNRMAMHAHRGEVTGIAVDCNAEVMVTAGSVDPTIKFWMFKESTYYGVFKLSAPVQKMFSRPVSNLFGAALTDFSIMILDSTTFGLIRKLMGCSHPITDACFSPDMKWVTAATSDGCFRTWDVPTGSLIDICRLWDGIITSLDYSPHGEYLVTTMTGQLGVTIWINQSMYDYVSLLPIPETYEPSRPNEIPKSKAPKKSQPTIESMFSKLRASEDSKDWLIDNGRTARQLFWNDLMNINENKARNKPAASFKKKEVVPFILGSVFTNQIIERNTTVVTDENVDKKKSEISNGSSASKSVHLDTLSSTFARKLSALSFNSSGSCIDESECAEIVGMLEEMGFSQLDLEIRSLSPENGGEREQMLNFLKLLIMMTKGKKHFLIIQTCLALYLDMYEDMIWNDGEFQILLHSLDEHQEAIRSFLVRLCTKVNGLSDYSSNDLL